VLLPTPLLPLSTVILLNNCFLSSSAILSAISEYLSEVHPTKVVKHGIQDVFGQSADGETMLTNYGLRAKDIAETAIGEIVASDSPVQPLPKK